MQSHHARSLKLLPIATLALVACRSGVTPEGGLLAAPEAPRSDALDIYHGTPVADPYRPLEDCDAPGTRAWIEAENQRTQAWLARVPQRGELLERLRKLYAYERYGLPEEHGGSYYFTYNDGTMQQSVLCRTRSLGAAREVVLDPNGLSNDGTVSLSGTAFSHDGRLMAYALSDGGSDWRTWRVLDLASLKETGERLEWIKFTFPAWARDGSGFYYSRYPAIEDKLEAKNEAQSVYFHRIGESQAQDRLVYEDSEHPNRMYAPITTDDGRFLLLSISESSGNQNRLYLHSLEEPTADWVPLFDVPDAEYEPLTNEGWLFLLKTTKDAPNGRVVRVDAKSPGGPLVDVIPERDSRLQSASRVGERLFATYLEDASSVVRVYDLQGKQLGTVDLPDRGTVAGFGGERDDVETFYSFSSYTVTPTIFRYDLAGAGSSVFQSPRTAFDASPYRTEQVFYQSKDGTRVPLWITAKKDVARDGRQPTLLYGYGGFDIPLTPGYSPTNALWLELGGIYAVANLRGGGEYGENWHQAGTKERKQNVFDDFVAAAEYLIAEGYTSTEKLAIYGGSNGGLLVGACVNQRPDLFAAAMPAVGVMDMLRYHRFTIGRFWASDYGTSEDPEMFPYLYKYSPLHNIRPGTHYPAVFVTTGDHDDRVVPGHSFKYAAALQAAQAGEQPILIRIESRAGHGAGKSLQQQLEETADRFAFLVETLGVSVDL